VSTDLFELRRNDFTLDDEQVALQDSFRAYFEKTVPASRVRAAEPLGFDRVLWDEMQERAIVEMALPETANGDGAGLVELALVVEEAGRRAAPVPLPDVLAAVRGLAQVGADADLIAQIRDNGAIATVAPGITERRLVPSGAIASSVLAPRGDSLVLVEGDPRPLAPNLGSSPLGWWHITDANPLGTHADWALIEREWHVLTAAELVGLGQAAVDLAVQYAKERIAFGVPIGSLQAIAHPLVNAANCVDAARRLVWRAAWFCDNEPELVDALSLCAVLAAGDAAEQAGATAIHTQGGFGVTLESDVQLFYRRAKARAVMAGDRRSLLRRVTGHALRKAASAR
jgi:alkylation response protein AidB-like acyl-CoA dehydrogenase